MSQAPLLTRPFLLLVSGHFLQALGYASMPLLPLYLSHLGASRVEIGSIMGVGAMGGLLLRPLVGWALDNVGRKKTVVVSTLTLFVGMALFGLCTDLGPLVYIARIIEGIGTGALFAAYFTFVADLIPPSRRTEGIALFGVSGLLPMIVSPVAEHVGVNPPDLQWFFPLIGVIVLASLIPIMYLKEPPPPETHTPSPPIRKALMARSLLPVWWITIIFSGGLAVFMAFASVIAAARGADYPADLWFSYAFTAVAVRIIGPRIPALLGPRNIIAPAMASYAVAFLLLATTDSTQVFLLAGGLAGLGHGYCFPVLTGQVISRAPPQLRGSALAAFTALWEVSALSLTPTFGAIADRFDDATMCALVAVMIAFGLGVWVVLESLLGVASAEDRPTSTSPLQIGGG